MQSAAAATATLRVAILLLLPQQECCCFRLLFVIVCPMAKLVAGSLDLLPVFVFSSFRPRFFAMVPFGSTVSHFRPRFACEYILGNYGYTRSQGGREPAAAKPLL